MGSRVKVFIEADVMDLAEIRYFKLPPSRRGNLTLFDIAQQIVQRTQSNVNRFQSNGRAVCRDGVWEVDESFICPEKKISRLHQAGVII